MLVYLPLNKKTSYDETKPFARAIAQLNARGSYGPSSPGGISPNLQWETQIPGGGRPDLFIYDRTNYATMLAQIQYYPALSDMTDALTAVDPAAASNPLINPPQSTLDMLKAWKALSDTEEQELVTIYTDVTGG